MENVQSAILQPPPRLARYLTLDLKHGGDPGPALTKLADYADGDSLVVGIGLSLCLTFNKTVEGLKNFPSHIARAVEVPATHGGLWLWLRGDDRGALLHRTRQVTAILSEAFETRQIIDGFQYRDSRDLTGYEDGTENPEGEEAINASIVQGVDEGMDGSSFVAVQQWLHDLDYFQSLPQATQDNTVGRRISDNEEIEDAPESAHVKRTAQEDFDPEAFVVRRSMPWVEGSDAGLVFVAFGKSFDAYEALLNRMTGVDDGIIDALFQFTRPLTGGFFWCPPMKNGRLDLRVLGL